MDSLFNDILKCKVLKTSLQDGSLQPQHVWDQCRTFEFLRNLALLLDGSILEAGFRSPLQLQHFSIVLTVFLGL